jgi:hypothetical protein
MLWLLVVVGLARVPPGVATVRLPDLRELAAAARGDDVELERVATRLGAVRLARIAARGRPEERLAALRGLALVDDGWAMLPDVARLCADPERDVAERAASSALRIAQALSPETMEREEIPRDVPQRAAAELLAAAAQPTLRPSVRVAAIAAVAALRGVTHVPSNEAQLAARLSDPEPEVRRAAAEALAGVPEGERALEAALADDASPSVAAAAAASLCHDVTPTPGKPNAPSELRAARLGPKARERLRALALAVDGEVSLADRLDLVACLRVAASPADKQALDQLARRPPESLRRRARALGGR